MQTRSWDDKASGEKKYRTEVVADRVQFGAKTGGGGTASEGGAKGKAGAPAAVETIEYPTEDINPEDIPF